MKVTDQKKFILIFASKFDESLSYTVTVGRIYEVLTENAHFCVKALYFHIDKLSTHYYRLVRYYVFTNTAFSFYVQNIITMQQHYNSL